MSISLVYVTTENIARARHIGRILVEDRLAACANIIDQVKSIYWWNGKIEEGEEVILIVKTQSSLVEAVIKRVGELHHADTPCAIELAVNYGNQDFLDWVKSETA